MNQVILIGNLASQPELKSIGQNQTKCSFRIATNESYKDKQGQWQSTTEFHNVVTWGKLAEVVSDKLVKGEIATVVGKLHTRSWEDQGVKKYLTEIIASKVQFYKPKETMIKKQDQGNIDFGPEPTFSDDQIPF